MSRLTKKEWLLELHLHRVSHRVSERLGEELLRQASAVSRTYGDVSQSAREELREEALLGMFESLEKFDFKRGTSPGSYFWSVALRAINNYLRREHSEEERVKRYAERVGYRKPGERVWFKNWRTR